MEDAYKISSQQQQQKIKEIKSDLFKIRESKVLSIDELDSFLHKDLIEQIKYINKHPKANQEFKTIILNFLTNSLNLIKHIQYQNNLQSSKEKMKICQVNKYSELILYKEQKIQQYIKQNLNPEIIVQAKDEIPQIKLKQNEFLIQFDFNVYTIIKKWQKDLMIRQLNERKIFFSKCNDFSRRYQNFTVKQPKYLYKFDWLCLKCCNINHNQRTACHQCKEPKNQHRLIQAL